MKGLRDLSDIVDQMLSYARAEPLIAIAAGVVIIALAFRKPKLFFSLLFLGLLLWVIYSAIMELASSGVTQKEKMLKREPGEIEQSR